MSRETPEIVKNPKNEIKKVNNNFEILSTQIFVYKIYSCHSGLRRRCPAFKKKYLKTPDMSGVIKKQHLLYKHDYNIV